MRALASRGLDRWTRGTRLVGLVALAGWAVLLPVDVAWTAVLAAVLIASAVAAAVTAGRPEIHSLGQAMATAGTRRASGMSRGPADGTSPDGPGIDGLREEGDWRC